MIGTSSLIVGAGKMGVIPSSNITCTLSGIVWTLSFVVRLSEVMKSEEVEGEEVKTN